MHYFDRTTPSHAVPPWIDPSLSDYFVTICCQQRGTNQLCLPLIGDSLLASARHYYEQRKWFPSLFLLMPDHLHLLVSFGRDQDLTKVITAWKRYTARRHNIVWQRDFFEHRLRSTESITEKSFYILQNPVRAGLIEPGESWPYTLMLTDSGTTAGRDASPRRPFPPQNAPP